MLPLLEIFLELCCEIASSAVLTFFLKSSVLSLNLHPFKADIIFGNSHKSYAAKLGNGGGGCSISVINFLGQKLLDSAF
jgi:hypothetical protein